MLIYGSFLIKIYLYPILKIDFSLFISICSIHIIIIFYVFYSFGTLSELSILSTDSKFVCALHIKRWMWIWLLQSTHLLNGKSQLDVWHVHKSIFHTECMSMDMDGRISSCMGGGGTKNWDSIRATINLTFHYYLYCLLNLYV